jgi:hypothetical protein
MATEEGTGANPATSRSSPPVSTSANGGGSGWRLCANAARVVIEVDVDSQAEQIAYDAERMWWLTDQRNYHVIRFTNHEAHHNLAAGLDTMALKRPPPSSVANRGWWRRFPHRTEPGSTLDVLYSEGRRGRLPQALRPSGF